MLVTISRPPPTIESPQSVNRFCGGSEWYTEMNCIVLFLIRVLCGQSLHSDLLYNFTNMHAMSYRSDFFTCSTSAKDISVQAECFRQSGRAASELSEIPRWQNAPFPAPIRLVALHIGLRLRFRLSLSLCRYPIVNEQCGVVANCDHMAEWVHWVHQQNVNRSGRHTQGSISTKHFVYHIRLCYSHNIRYLIIW